MAIKFFKTTGEGNSYTLYVCDATTPIPTMKEIIEEENLSPSCENEIVEEITKEDFLYLRNELLAELSDSANDTIEWASNSGTIATWKWWYSERD